MCFIFSVILAVGHPGAKMGPWGTNNTLCSAPSAERGDKRHIRGCLRGGPAGVRLGAPPLSAWLIRGTSEALNPRRSWPGSLALWEEVASCWAWALSCRPLRGGWRWFGCLLSQVQVWGDCKQLEVSVASLEMTSEPPGSIPQSPPQLVPTGCLTKPERRGRELCPPLTSPPSWARGGTLILPGWTTNTQLLGRRLWWHAGPGLSCSSGPWVKLHPDRLPHWRASCSGRPEAQL